MGKKEKEKIFPGGCDFRLTEKVVVNLLMIKMYTIGGKEIGQSEVRRYNGPSK